jgi:hypothetical protein
MSLFCKLIILIKYFKFRYSRFDTPNLISGLDFRTTPSKIDNLINVIARVSRPFLDEEENLKIRENISLHFPVFKAEPKEYKNTAKLIFFR